MSNYMDESGGYYALRNKPEEAKYYLLSLICEI